MSASLHDDHAMAKLHKWKHSNDVKSDLQQQIEWIQKVSITERLSLELSLVCHETTTKETVTCYQNILWETYFCNILSHLAHKTVKVFPAYKDYTMQTTSVITMSPYT